MRNIKTIQLEENKSTYSKYIIDKYLRFAKNEGDIEKINHYIYGQLKYFEINFIEIN